MTQLAEVALAGLSAGVIYALIALGFAVIYRATGVLNFAHGALLLTSAIVVALATGPLGFWGGFACGIVITALLGAALDRLLFRWVPTREHIRLAVLTFAVDAIAIAVLSKWIGTRILTIDDPWGDGTMSLGSISIPAARVAGACLAGMALLGFFATIRYTNWGLMMRAATEDPEAAGLAGVRVARISTSAWAIGGALAAVAGVFLCVFPTPGVTPSVYSFALQAFPAAVLGGLGSFGGAVLGAMVLGMAESLAAGYASELGFLGAGFSTVVPWIVLFLVLLVRPGGLFARVEMQRV